MLLGLLCLSILCAALLVLRRRASTEHSLAAWRVPPSRLEVGSGALLVLASCFPLLTFAPLMRAAGVFPSDAASHAKVALELSRHGLPHGWLDSYLGGFPFGHHYPPLGWLLLALGMNLGLSASTAVNGLGLAATLAAPLALYAACVRAGARPLHAACAGCLLALVSPYNSFIGGFETYFMTGLVSQVVALPLCISFAAAAARGARAEATVLAALSMSAHPQLCGATVVLTGVGALLDGARGRRSAVACALGAAVLAGAALYGQGLRTLHVPFGWPPGLAWRQVGFGTTRLLWWFRDGDLLDRGSTIPALTSLVLAAALTGALLFKRRAARALLLTTLAAVTLSSTGPALMTLRWGPSLLEFAQPLRILALLAPLLAALLAVTLEEAAGALRAALQPGRERLRRLLPYAGPAISLCVLALAVPARVRAAEQLRDAWAAPAAERCVGVPGFERAHIAEWFRSLRGGSLWFEQGEGLKLATCLLSQGLELESAVPIGITTAVGSHVGVLSSAAQQLQPERAGAAARARALGVRYVIRDARDHQTLPPGFTRRAVSGPVELLELPHVERAHLGCVRERWTGSDRALRERLLSQLSTAPGVDQLLDPERFVELVPAEGDVTITRVDDSECDPTSATLRVVEREPGLLEAVIDSAHPVDLVFSATAFPAWRLSVDGATELPARTIAPGYISARIAAGRHRVVAKAGTMPGYGGWLALATASVIALAWLETRHLRAAGLWLRQLAKKPLEQR